MAGANSRAAIALIFAVFLVSSSTPTSMDVRSKYLCKAECKQKCGGLVQWDVCFQDCYDQCVKAKKKGIAC